MTNTRCTNPKTIAWAARGFVFAGLLAHTRVS